MAAQTVADHRLERLRGVGRYQAGPTLHATRRVSR